MMAFGPSARSLLALGVVGLLAACSGAEDEGAVIGDDESEAISRKPNQVEMNDVSVLYPLAKSDAELAGYVSAASPGVGGPMLPAKLYTDTTHQPKARTGPANIGSDVGLAYDDLRAVAFRVDPCFAKVGPVTNVASCKNQLRIIFQPVQVSGGSSSTVDGAVHAFYSLSREELTTVLSSIVELRKQQAPAKSSGPLAVHPILVAQGLLGNEAKGLQSILLAHAGAKNLVRFTIFTPANLATQWHFSGFDIANGKATPMVIPTLAGNQTTVSFFAGFRGSLSGGFTPSTTSKEDMQLLGNLDQAKAATKAVQQSAFDAALRIENPGKHSPDTIDCASCHVAGPAEVLTGGALGLSATGNPNAFKPDTKLVRVSETKQTTPVGPASRLNFHAFSYRNDQPMISKRVINETASVVAYVNGTILK